MIKYPSKENLQISSEVSDGVIEVIGEYFPKNTVSVGSITRKLPYLLMSLVRCTGTEWTARFEYIKTRSRFETVLTSENGEKIVICNDTASDSSAYKTFQVMNAMFRSDKWIKTDVTLGKVKLYTQSYIFVYTKTKYSGEDKPIYVFTVSGKKRVFGSIKAWFSDTDSTKVDKFEVLETSTTPFVY